MSTTFTHLPLKGLVEIVPDVYKDSRGLFLEWYKESLFKENGIEATFVQDNHSLSQRGVLRGIHYQKPPFAQAKLVRVITGAVFDVAVDLRQNSPTYLQWYGTELSAKNQKMLYIPQGFGHGFVALEDTTNFMYKCDAEYSPSSEHGVRWDDPTIAIEWPTIAGVKYSFSPKDLELPYLGGR